jgi:hypothetical protein
VHVAETREKAWDECEAALHFWIGFYRRRGFEMPQPPVGELRKTPGAGIFGQPFAVGTPDEVVEALSVHKGVDLDEMVLQFNHAGMPPEPVANSMRLFASEVMQELRTWGRAPSELQRSL